MLGCGWGGHGHGCWCMHSCEHECLHVVKKGPAPHRLRHLGACCVYFVLTPCWTVLMPCWLLTAPLGKQSTWAEGAPTLQCLLLPGRGCPYPAVSPAPWQRVSLPCSVSCSLAEGVPTLQCLLLSGRGCPCPAVSPAVPIHPRM